MQAYVEKITPNVSDKWRADEIRMKVKGNMKYLFSMMDYETRFWIAQKVADKKEYHDVRTLFTRSKVLMGKQPKTIITDGLNSYSVAAETILDETKHIRHITLHGDHNNNKMERLNGEVRDLEKVMRGLKTTKTEIFNGYQIYHNYIRPHESLEGKTPAEACRIRIAGKTNGKP
jgi:putative transposase